MAALRARFSSRVAMEHSQRVMSQQALLVPHLPSGEIDWNTLGKILTASLVGEVLCASYIDEKHRVVQKTQFTVDTDWRYAYEEKGVVVLRKEFPGSPYHCWMGRTIIERPLKEIAEFLKDPTSALIYDKHITQSRHIKVLSASEAHRDIIAYYYLETKECLVTARRDFLFYARHTEFDDKYVMTALSVDHPECPPLEGVPRAQLQEGSGWHLERYMGSNSKTLITYIVHTDLKELPPIIANRALKRQPLNVYYIKNHLMQLQQPSATFSVSLPDPLPPSDNQTSCSYSGHHFEEHLPVAAFTEKNKQTEIIKGERVTTSQNDIQPSWQNVQVSDHSDEDDDIDPIRKD